MITNIITNIFTYIFSLTRKPNFPFSIAQSMHGDIYALTHPTIVIHNEKLTYTYAH